MLLYKAYELRIPMTELSSTQIALPLEGQRVGKISQIQQHKLVELWRSVATIDPTNNMGLGDFA
jgi:hypothetical protein